ncbi:MAG: response regulator [Candidatus Omnitrophica bacterium]|nr:response regulator [Candidatus Omnitrophota bacterium]
MEKKIFRVLVVDDEMDIRNVLTSFLPKKLNVEVFTTGDGQKAVEMARDLKLDLILLDIHLPGHMGWDVLREIREFDQDVKIVISTGIFVVPKENEEFLLQHTSGYMIKPVNLEAIYLKIVEALGDQVVRK